MKKFILASSFAILGFSASAYSSSMTCNQMDVKTSSGEEHGYGYPTKFTENDNQVGFILVNKKVTLPPFHEVSDGVYGTKVPNYILVKKFLGEEVVYILQVRSSGEKILFRECS